MRPLRGFHLSLSATEKPSGNANVPEGMRAGIQCLRQDTLETPENSTVRFEEEERHARSTDRKTRQCAGALFAADPPQRSLPYCRAVAGDAADPRCVYGGAGGGCPSLRAGFPGGGGRDFLSESRRRAVTGCVRARPPRSPPGGRPP